MYLSLIFFAFLCVVLVVCALIADRTVRKRDIDEMKNLVSGKAVKQGHRENRHTLAKVSKSWHSQQEIS